MLTALIATVSSFDPSVPDADVAKALSAVIKTPRDGRIDFTSVGAIWGPARAAMFKRALKLAAQQTESPELSALADYVHDLLSGNGFDPNAVEAPKVAAVLVAAKLCTQDEVDGVLNVVTTPDPVSEQDVADARAYLARRALALELREYLGRASVACAEQCAAFERGEVEKVDRDSLAALFASTK